MHSNRVDDAVALVEAKLALLEDIREQTEDAPSGLTAFIESLGCGGEFAVPPDARVEAGFAAGYVQAIADGRGITVAEIVAASGAPSLTSAV